MATMKYPNVSGGSNMAVSGNGAHVDDVESLFTSSCWQTSASNVDNAFIDTHKLMISDLGSDKLLLDNQDNDIPTKVTMDAFDNLLLTQPINTNLAELKPLPPFTGYTGHLSINGIQGHHYHAISQRMPEENNNYNSFNEQNSIVSSSTCNITNDSPEDTKPMYGVDEVIGSVKIEYTDCVNPDSVSGTKIYDECGHPDAVSQVKTAIAEYMDDDIATLLGSAIADTTVNNNTHEEGSRDSWLDLNSWFDGDCSDQPKSITITQEGLSEFDMQSSPQNNNEFSKSQMEYKTPAQSGSTLQNLLTHGYMPLLQNRLQNGPPIKQEPPSSTNYVLENSTSSPPSVVSTTDSLILNVNGRFMHHYNLHGLPTDDRIRSPDILGQNYPHTTTTTPNTSKKSRSRAPKKQQQTANSNVFQTEQNLGLLGKEKPVHRCSICNRGFLNKSNIKVHLRTHTGEKPFRCDTCAKAFRQKAHLLKHQQIHKRIGRD